VRPVLFHLGPLTVHSWGAALAIAFIAAWWVLRHELERQIARGEVAGELMLAAAGGGFLGARLYWFVEHLGSVSLIGGGAIGGFTWYGGVIGGVIAVYAVARWRRVAIGPLLGAAAPALAIGYGIGRIGCQLAGDGTYGVASNLPWAMSYPHGEVPTTQRVHPTPVYEMLASFLIFAVLWRLRTKLPPVQLFAVYLVLSGAERFLVEFLRRNEHVLVGLTQPQLFSAALVVLGLTLLSARRDSAVPAGLAGHLRE
jgi:phosphatidylglycerol---prolipoprotein diacylglyceryl transferase